MRRLARPLLAAAFIESGMSALRHPGPVTDSARPLVERVAGPLHLPNDPETFVRVEGAVMVGAASLLAAGRLPRLASAALVLSTVPAATSGLAFWRTSDPVRRREQRRALLARVGLIGGALIAAADTGGRAGLARSPAAHPHREAAHLAHEARHAASDRAPAVRETLPG